MYVMCTWCPCSPEDKVGFPVTGLWIVENCHMGVENQICVLSRGIALSNPKFKIYYLLCVFACIYVLWGSVSIKWVWELKIFVSDSVVNFMII